MAGDVTIGFLKRLSYCPEDSTPDGNLIAGQNYYNVYFTGGTISNVTFTNCIIPSTSTRTYSMLAATKASIPNNDFIVTTGSPACMNTRSSHYTPANSALTNPQLVYSNWVAHLASGIVVEASNANAITVSASIEYPSGTFTPVYFNGSRTITLSASSNGGKPAAINTICDAAGIEIPANTQFWIRTLVSVATPGAMTWPTGSTMLSGQGEGAVTNTSVTDLTLSGTITPNSVNGYYPSAIIGCLAGSAHSGIIVGDSIADGTGDNMGGDAFGNTGYPARILKNTYGYTKLTRSSDQAQYFIGNNSPWNYLGRMSVQANRATFALCEMGINDVTANVSLSQIQANLTTLWGLFSNQGLAVYACTLSPHTTSTDNFASGVNQTVGAFEPVRVGLNNWIRTKPSPLTGYIEAADTFETSRNSGIWKFNGTANYWTLEGTHPSALAHQAVATANSGIIF